ncbi:MAG: MMPL family transporter [Candidatus Sumerlaeia bacterium]|nr:MMPL family transporter [Candidatus Sumerlaeia bacterium]
MSRRAISYIGKKSGQWPYWSLFLVFLLTIPAVWATFTRLKVEMDVTALLPQDSRVRQEDRRAFWDFGTHDFMLCVLEIKSTASPSIADNPGEFLKSIQPRIETSLDDQRFFRRKTDKLQPRQVGLEAGSPSLVSILLDSDFDLLEQTILPDYVAGSVNRLLERVGDDPTTETLQAISRDPFGFEELFLERTTVDGGPLQPVERDGYYISEDGTMLLIVLWPQQKASDLIFTRQMKNFLTETRQGLYARNPSWRAAVDIQFMGPHVESALGAADVKRDIILTTTVSFISVLLLFFAAFRQPEALILVAIPLVVGLFWTMGITSLFVERITQVTLTFAAILIGLGIDFSIHLYNRYLEYYRAGQTAGRALINAMTFTGPTIVAGAITTGFAFFGMALTRFEGFRELGLFGGIGIFMSLIAVAVTLPPLMIIFSRITRRNRDPIATLGLKKVTFTVQAYPRMTVAAGLCIVVYLGFYAREARFNDDFQSLRQPPERYIQLADRVNSQFDLPGNQLVLIVEGETLDRALENNDRLFQNIQNQARRYNFISIDSLREAYPSEETQRRNVARFARLPIERARTTFREHLAGQEGLPDDFLDPWLGRLVAIQQECQQALATPGSLVSFDRIGDPDFVNFVQRHLIKDDTRDVYRVITRVYPADNEWTMAGPEYFVEAISHRLDQQPLVLGSAIISQELRAIIITDLAKIIIFVFICVVAYLVFYFRSVPRALLAMVPVIFALLSMLGVIHLLNIELNYLNIIALPMIVGIGVDSGIHFLGRFYEGGGNNMRFAIEKTGRAIVITGFTTIFGFGALCVASFPGIREIGIIAIVGVACTLFASLVFLPAVLRLLDPRVAFTGGAGDEIG